MAEIQTFLSSFRDFIKINTSQKKQVCEDLWKPTAQGLHITEYHFSRTSSFLYTYLVKNIIHIDLFVRQYCWVSTLEMTAKISILIKHLCGGQKLIYFIMYCFFFFNKKINNVTVSRNPGLHQKQSATSKEVIQPLCSHDTPAGVQHPALGLAA